MRVCLIPLKIEARNPAANLRSFEQRLATVLPHRPDLICLPECAFTGYLYEEHDLERFAEPISGPTTHFLARVARENHCYICFGMLEKANQKVYSSAVLLDRSGQIILVHRKLHEHPPLATGDEVRAVDTELGRVHILLCGDLFDDHGKALLHAGADILIVPLARSFDGQSPDVARWLTEERQVYADEVKKVGLTTLIVNALEDSSQDEVSFGGALVISPTGEILAETMHGSDEMLIFDLVSGKMNGG